MSEHYEIEEERTDMSRGLRTVLNRLVARWLDDEGIPPDALPWELVAALPDIVFVRASEMHAEMGGVRTYSLGCALRDAIVERAYVNSEEFEPPHFAYLAEGSEEPAPWRRGRQ